MKENDKPKVLIGGGVGFTPMLSMLETLLDTDNAPKTTYIHCVKNAYHHAFANHVDKLAEKSSNFASYAFYSQPTEKKISLENTKISDGRIAKQSLKNVVGNPKECDFYFCGPKPFIISMLMMLKDLEVPENQISYEYFGPQLQSSL